MNPASHKDNPAAIVVGGDANALSIARSLNSVGVAVYALTSPSSLTRHSRTCRWVPPEGGDGNPESWITFLLGPRSDHLRGAVVLACSDEAIEMIVEHRQSLAERFILEEASDELRLCLLDKLSTYEKSAEAGVPTPKYWRVWSVADLDEIKNELIFPLIIKPLFSHHTRRIWKNQKYLAIQNYDELLRNFSELQRHGIEFLLMEYVPGGDDLLCSYYTYMDENGTPLFHFTKRVIRRHPEGMGEGCYHITDWSPDVRDMALKFFHHVSLRGLGNVEFKRDPRDGKLKMIECNARFTAANCLVKAAGLDLALLSYNKLTKRPLPPMDHYRTGLTLWRPTVDFLAFLKLRRKGALTFPRWFLGVLRPHRLQYFSWSDPMPAVVGAWRRIAGVFRKRFVRPLGKVAALR